MKHYYALAVELEEQDRAEELRALALEWWDQHYSYRVFGALLRATEAHRPPR